MSTFKYDIYKTGFCYKFSKPINVKNADNYAIFVQ